MSATQFTEQNPNFTLEIVPDYLWNNIVISLALLSGVMFFFTLCFKQFNRRK